VTAQHEAVVETGAFSLGERTPLGGRFVAHVSSPA